jgi:hypothetical protein
MVRMGIFFILTILISCYFFLLLKLTPMQHIGMKRKPYLLLELLIAFTLVALCALPLVHDPLHSLRSEIQIFEKVELERLAEVSFADLKAELYRNEIPWEAFDTSKYKLHKQDSVRIQLKGVCERTYLRSYYLSTKYHKKAADQEDHRIVNIKIAFTKPGKGKQPKPFYYLTYLAKFALKPNQNKN